jgi:hypothetical protein
MKDNQMDRDLTPDEIMKQWETLRKDILSYWDVVTGVLVPAIQQVMDAICAFVVQLQRVQLLTDLMQHWWMPDWLAYWLSDKWPERWLPELRFE